MATLDLVAVTSPFHDSQVQAADFRPIDHHYPTGFVAKQL
jgi:hypothetical protein